VTSPLRADGDEREGRPVRRIPALAVIAALLVAGGVVDRVREEERVREPVGISAVMPTAHPASALSSTWYCAAATAAPRGMADGSVILANPGDAAVSGRVSFIPSDPAIEVRTVPVEIRAKATVVVRHQSAIQAPFASALVELDGGGVAVEHSVSGPLGADVAPCASGASDRWYFADGGTTKDAVELLALFNPFPEDAIVDLAFSTEEGRVVPQALQALVVRARGLSVVNVGEQVVRRKAVSASVVARTGRLVVDRLQTYDGSQGRRGLALVLGATAPAPTWYFPEGYFADGVIERFQLYNPTDEEAQVDVDVALERGAAEPFSLVVPPHGRATLLASAEPRIPREVGHAVTVRSTNGVGVVVERSIDASAPSPRIGLASTMGARAASRRWAFPAGLVSDTVDEWLLLQNPGPRPAVVSVVALADGQSLAIAGLQEIRLPPGRRRAIRLGDHIRRVPLPLVVSASQPIVAERGIYRVRALGISIVAGIPLR
jgi:hypothetical protein